ncbi:MAG: hypothetical protein IJT97_09455 [Bacteroidaceae bacterium]|nr:hypothetical protein [Bacteroidaceae bacterium]
MTTIELRSSISTDLDLLSAEMLENVSRYVKRLVSHARTEKKSVVSTARKKIEITPGVARLRTGHSLHVTDNELDKARYEYLMEKYK